jgi:hypothetical protein
MNLSLSECPRVSLVQHTVHAGSQCACNLLTSTWTHTADSYMTYKRSTNELLKVRELTSSVTAAM